MGSDWQFEPDAGSTIKLSFFWPGPRVGYWQILVGLTSGVGMGNGRFPLNQP